MWISDAATISDRLHKLGFYRELLLKTSSKMLWSNETKTFFIHAEILLWKKNWHYQYLLNTSEYPQWKKVVGAMLFFCMDIGVGQTWDNAMEESRKKKNWNWEFTFQQKIYNQRNNWKIYTKGHSRVRIKCLVLHHTIDSGGMTHMFKNKNL